MTLFLSQPQSVLGVIDNSLKVYRATFLKVLPFSIPYAIITAIPSLLLFHIIAIPSLNTVLFISTISIGCALISLLLVAVIYARIFFEVQKENRGYNASFKLAFSKYPIYLISSVVYFVINVVGFLFFVLPGVFFSVYFCFYFIMILFEQEDVVESFWRSTSLIKDHWWRTLGALIIPVIVLTLILRVMEWFSGLRLVFLTHFPSFEKAVHGHCITVAIMAILMPWFLSVMLCQYQDLKLRRSSLASDR